MAAVVSAAQLELLMKTAWGQSDDVVVAGYVVGDAILSALYD